jgi:hypothetical protein
MRRVIAGLVLVMCGWLVPAAGAATPHVLRVGTYKGAPGQFSTIQAAVNAAKPGDFILIAPGDYKTHSYLVPKSSVDYFPAGILIRTPHLTLRGMNRNTVIVDGTKAGPACTDNPSDQNFGPPYQGHQAGLNGVMVYKANDVDVENMTACNFLGGQAGDGQTGNEFWWNGGADSGQIGGWGYYGAYLNGTSTWYNPDTSLTQIQREASAAEYGIFSSNWDGGTWFNTYTSNMNDSGYYIGACQQQCNLVVDKAWGEYSALGYSGSNSGGSLVVENSQFDNNEDGFDTNSQNGDNPPPQNGSCPNGGISPITHTHSCWVFMDNDVHNNNNPNVPAAGSAAAGPVGTGMTISGGRFDTVMGNTFANNGAWGDLIVPYPDSGPPCTGGTPNYPLLGQGSCLYDEYGDAIIDNKYSNDGYWKNPTNGDFEALNFENGEPTDCFSGNTDASGSLPQEDQQLEKEYPTCNGKAVDADDNPVFLQQVLCDSQVEIDGTDTCTPADNYPRFTNIYNGLHPLPAASQLPTMPNVCGGIPADPWCSGETTTVKGCAAPTVSVPLSTAVGEKVKSVAVKVNGTAQSVTAGTASVRVSLGAVSGTAKVLVTETLTVGKHAETFTFTRVYKRC